MTVKFQYGIQELELKLPESCIVYKSDYVMPLQKISDMLLNSLDNPVSGKPLSQLLKNRIKGNVVIVVSDITRPIPYSDFLPRLLAYLEAEGINRDEITILISTGMHRATTRNENLRMFGKYVVSNYRIIGHESDNEEELASLDGLSWSGLKIRLNKHYIGAAFRIVTGLVEPHFMAGFSGGRKAICPGLASLDAIQNFHGYEFLNHTSAAAAILENNPCHLESSSVARLCPPDFAVNVVLDNNKKINTLISGELFTSHEAAVDYVKKACCPQVPLQADLAVTSCGGYPLDATFYQCVKGFVNCLPSIRDNGEIVAFGACSEGIGSMEYTSIMNEYSGNHMQFIEDIKDSTHFIKDQWEFQMHIKALEKTGINNLHFYTSKIRLSELSKLSINPHSVHADEIEKAIQDQIDLAVRDNKTIAVFPEGPYCSPVPDKV
jgi:nickel-dependent lactate racemase